MGNNNVGSSLISKDGLDEVSVMSVTPGRWRLIFRKSLWGLEKYTELHLVFIVLKLKSGAIRWKSKWEQISMREKRLIASYFFPKNCRLLPICIHFFLFPLSRSISSGMHCLHATICFKITLAWNSGALEPYKFSFNHCSNDCAVIPLSS